MISVFAPGKLFVIGEYVVLDGERALVAAVDAGIECRVEAGPGGWHLAAPDVGVGAAVPLADASREPRAALLARAVECGAREFPDVVPATLTVRGRGTDLERKVGLGGSAASVVAILGAFAAAAGRDLAESATRRRLFDLAHAVHREHQGGRGSGADVAASVYGGWLDYAIDGDRPRAQPAAIPAGLALAAAWSGCGSDTASGIESFAKLRGEGEGAAIERGMRAGLVRFWRALERGDRAEMLAALGEYGALLEDVARRLAPGFAERMSDLARAAMGCGVAAKSSGAVGGDCVIALGFDPAALASAREAWRGLGAAVLEIGIDLAGVRRMEAIARA